MFSRALVGTGVAIFSTSQEGGRGILGRTLRSCVHSVCPGYPRELHGHCQGGGGPVSATSRGPGTPRGLFSTLLGGLRGLRGLLRMIGISVARHTARPLSRALLHQPLGNFQDTRYHVTPA